MAVTVPGTMTLVSAKANHRGATLYYEATCIRRVIPEAKVTAVKAALTADGDSVWGIDYGGAVTPFRDGRGFKIRFKAAKTEAQLNTFLAAVETAVTT